MTSPDTCRSSKAGTGKNQPRYRLKLWVTAADNNIETGPAVASSKERFNLVIVSENELLAEIAKEEESLHLKLEQAVDKLRIQRTHLEDVQRRPECRQFQRGEDFPVWRLGC